MATKSSLYKEVLREYDQLKDASIAHQKEKQDLVYKRLPRIEEIDHEISMTGIKISKMTLLNPKDKEALLYQLKEELGRLKNEKTALLASIDLPATFLDKEYKCNNCKDTGYIDNKICKCMKQRLIEKAYFASNLKDNLKTENFDYFQIKYYSDNVDSNEGISPRENMETIFSTCINFTNNFDREFNNILLYGKSGLGKTFLCNCIAKELLDQGKTVIYVTAPRLFKMIEDSRFNKDEFQEPNTYLEDLISVDLLIIDDLGTEFSTILSSSELFNIINSRLLDKKPVIISTNLEMKDLINVYSERIVSRLTGNYTVLYLFGEDIRKLKKFNNL